MQPPINGLMAISPRNSGICKVGADASGNSRVYKPKVSSSAKTAPQMNATAIRKALRGALKASAMKKTQASSSAPAVDISISENNGPIGLP